MGSPVSPWHSSVAFETTELLSWVVRAVTSQSEQQGNCEIPDVVVDPQDCILNSLRVKGRRFTVIHQSLHVIDLVLGMHTLDLTHDTRADQLPSELQISLRQHKPSCRWLRVSRCPRGRQAIGQKVSAQNILSLPLAFRKSTLSCAPSSLAGV